MDQVPVEWRRQPAKHLRFLRSSAKTHVASNQPWSYFELLWCCLQLQCVRRRDPPMFKSRICNRFRKSSSLALFLRTPARVVKVPSFGKSNTHFKAERVAGVPLHLAKPWFHE